MIDKVNVAGIDYNVELHEYDEESNGNNTMGRCDHLKAVIKLNQNMSEQVINQTFIHELTHAIYWQAGFGDEQSGTEEDVVNRMSIVLYQVLKDNDFSWLRS